MIEKRWIFSVIMSPIRYFFLYIISRRPTSNYTMLIVLLLSSHELFCHVIWDFPVEYLSPVMRGAYWEINQISFHIAQLIMHTILLIHKRLFMLKSSNHCGRQPNALNAVWQKLTSMTTQSFYEPIVCVIKF